MEFITVYRTDNPAITREVSEASFRRWPNSKTSGAKEGAGGEWMQATSEAPIQPRTPKIPDVIERMMPKVEAKEETKEVTAAELVSMIHEASTIEAVDALVNGDERKTVINAADKRKAQLARQ